MVTAKLICVFVFAYADCWFSHEAAQITITAPILGAKMSRTMRKLFSILNYHHLKAKRKALFSNCIADHHLCFHCTDYTIPLVQNIQNFKPLPFNCDCIGCFMTDLVRNTEDHLLCCSSNKKVPHLFEM